MLAALTCAALKCLLQWRMLCSNCVQPGLSLQELWHRYDAMRVHIVLQKQDPVLAYRDACMWACMPVRGIYCNSRSWTVKYTLYRQERRRVGQPP